MKTGLLVPLSVMLIGLSCHSAAPPPASEFMGADNEVRLMTLNPGHFHAGLLQKYDYPQVDSVVHVYAPGGPEVEAYLDLVERFNTRAEDPTHWVEEVYEGEDYLERMLEERPGNVVVLAGNNARKIEYVRRAVDAGLNVFADKPMVIYPDDFGVLEETVASADAQGLLVNDIMTERHEVTSLLQRALSQDAALFGTLVKGTPEDPAMSKESVHHFYKTVAGEPLVRPAWALDVEQQGEGIIDVSTHLVDLILWQAFPGEPIDYEDPGDGVEVVSARRWTTDLTPAQFEQITRLDTYPDYLASKVDDDGILHVAANGAFVFKVRGVHAAVSVQWNFENPEGGDTHFSVMRGTRATLSVRQDEAQGFKPTLYVEPAEGVDPQAFAAALDEALAGLADTFPGVSARPSEFGREIVVPDELREGHEEHFARVTEAYLDHLVAGALPPWERANLLTKYYLTTRAYAKSR